MTILSDTNTDTDRISRLEGAYGHLATKADVAQLEAHMAQRMGEMETRLTWRLIGAVGAMVAAVAIIERFLS